MLWTRQIAPESLSWACLWAADPHKIPIDSNGNLTTKTEGSDVWGYEWNANNELTRVTKNSIEQARFAYDPLGRRVEKVAGGITTSYTYDGLDVLREVRGGTTLKYVHELGLDSPLAMDDGSSSSYLHRDGLESVVRWTNAAGAVSLTRQYDAWGNIEVGAGEPGYAFTGREWDPETGLHYYRARYYDPKVGRFLSEDPEGFIDGPNMYTYVLNNPVRLVDPWGLASCACPTKQKNCLDLLFNQPTGNVQIVTKPPSKKWSATTRKNKIIVYGSCDDFFADPDTYLEEYYHVLEQWNKGRLSKLKYAAAYALHGYDNKYEQEAKAWVQQNIQAYLDCLAKQD